MARECSVKGIVLSVVSSVCFARGFHCGFWFLGGWKVIMASFRGFYGNDLDLMSYSLELLEVLKDVSPSPSSGTSDSFRWRDNVDGCFSVKSYYSKLK